MVEKYIIQTADLADLVKSLSDQEKLALDIESNGFYHYLEKLCLIQLATVDAIYIVDPLSLIDINLLSPILSDESVQKIIHSADYDVRSLKRDWSFSINNLFDTSIAAAFIGSSKRGLNSVLMEYLNIPLEKDKKMFNKAKFKIGQIIHHKLFDYTGVVFDIDPIFQGSEEWYNCLLYTSDAADE